MKAWTFARALKFWRENRNNEDVDYDALSGAEICVLTHDPSSPVEAADMLDVILAQDGDARCDGLDAEALRRVMDYLRCDVALAPQALARTAA